MLVLFSLLIVSSVPAHAQLRPLEALNWGAFSSAHNVQLSGRIGRLTGQRASLAGTSGSLIELGEVQLTIRTGRILLEFAGTPQRFFEDKLTFAQPTGGADAAPLDGDRHDSGDYRVATAVRLTSTRSSWVSALRFGTRLPTTDNRVGLDRDQIDFFALLGARRSHGALTASVETGLAINGTRISTYEQADVFAYAATLSYQRSMVRPWIRVLGQEDLKSRSIRGNEDLGELRLGLRVGQRRWFEGSWVHGYRDFSPGNGFLIGGGYAFDW
jgi:hypothetical protein